MKSNVTRIVSMILSLLLMFTVVIPFSNAANMTSYSVNVPYDYPIRPGSDEWKSLSTFQEKIDVCQIPTNILENMTTEALLESILDYPLIVCLYVYSSPTNGIEIISQYFNGLNEYLNRIDAEETLNAKVNAPVTISNEDSTIDYDIISDRIVMNAISNVIAGDSSGDGGLSPLAMHDGYVYTPKNTPVPVKVDMDWENLNIYDAGFREDIIAKVESSFPDAIPLTSESCKYNCHSYAWYSQNIATNKVWMDDPSLYITDGSYASRRGSYYAQVNDNLLYGTAGNYPLHSAVVTRKSGSALTVCSKWDWMPLYEHKPDDCPYSYAPMEYFYRVY